MKNGIVYTGPPSAKFILHKGWNDYGRIGKKRKLVCHVYDTRFGTRFNTLKATMAPSIINFDGNRAAVNNSRREFPRLVNGTAYIIIIAQRIAVISRLQVNIDDA